MSKTSLGSKLLHDVITKREMSFQDVSKELQTMGYTIQRYSIWQWANGVSKPSLQNAFEMEEWSKGDIPAKAWLVNTVEELKHDLKDSKC